MAKKTSLSNAGRAYRWRWILLFIVSVLAGAVFWGILGYVEDLAEWVFDGPQPNDGIVANALKALAGVLFWWRATKVSVFLGSPFSLGLTIGYLRENGYENGRPVTVVFIEDTHPRGLLFGVVARSHPRSDKIVRNRVDLLMVALPRGRFLVVRGSRISIPKLTNSQRRQEFFDAWRGHHLYWVHHEISEQGEQERMVILLNFREPQRSL